LAPGPRNHTEQRLTITKRLALRGKNAADLRELAKRYLRIDPSTISAQELIEKLSIAAKTNSGLSNELGKSPIAIKPSFYLMVTTLGRAGGETAKRAKQYAPVLFDSINARLKKASMPSLSEFQVVAVENHSSRIVELQVTWHQILHYWSTSAIFEHVYTLRIGFIFIDVVTSKALICCHTITERDLITEPLEKHLDIRFTPITLTKQLLENIGSFEQVKRAGYLVSNPGANETEEVIYADERLAAKPTVTAQEKNPKYFRKHSFYRIDLGAAAETGLGVTADTAKLWIPAETPIENVRDYGLLLLKKFTVTLDKMKRDGDIPGILRVLKIQGSHALAKIPGAELRTEVTVLVHELVQMLLKDQAERPYTPPAIFLTNAIPQWFNPARLQLEDETTGATSFWSDPQKQTQFVSFSLQGGKWGARAFRGTKVLDLDALPHPMTGNPVRVTEPLRHLELWPTPQLHEALLQAIKQISSQLPKLRKIVALPFHIHVGRIVIDVANARQQSFADSLRAEIDVTSVRQFRAALQHSISSADSSRLGILLHNLGEKCAHMTDHNCEACLEQRKFLCLRSLVARFASEPSLLMHKGIELSDLQATLRTNGDVKRAWVFSKLSKGKAGLTLRNANGATLLAQITAQLDKTTFDTIGVLSPSTVNEDLRERLGFLAALVRKSVVVINRPILEKMLAHFEEQTKFENKDPRKVYSASRSKRAKGRDMEAAGRFV
jgi:hypothetical protein